MPTSRGRITRPASADRTEDRAGRERAGLVHAVEEREWWHSAEEAVRRLRSDRDEWADYLAEVDKWDTTSGDGLPDTARSEWPEFR